jgi:hypothetical protein
MANALDVERDVPLTGTLPDGPGGRGAIYFCVGDRSTQICGYAWRLWWGRTSFYIKARNEAFAGLKVSLHGADERHRATGRSFKIGYDDSVDRDATAQLSVTVGTPGWLPQWFTGREVPGHGTHVVRFRVPADLFEPGRPSAPNPGKVKAKDFAGLIPPPTPRLYAMDVDMFVSPDAPYWPNEAQARQDNACLGPLRSEAGDFLTGVIVRRSTLEYPTPELAKKGAPAQWSDAVRGIGATVDESGLLWICEQWMSRSELEADAAKSD